LFPCVGSGLVLAIGLTLAPFAAGAQPAERVTKIGILSTVNPRTATFFEAMVQRLRELGHVEGQNLVIEFRNAEGDVTRLPALAAELVRLNVNIILASGPEVTLQAARKATATVPIVIAAVDFDPVARGYIVSLAKPGGNITGVSLLQIELTGKRMQFLKEALPKVARVVVFWDTIFRTERGVEARRHLPTLSFRRGSFGSEPSPVRRRHRPAWRYFPLLLPQHPRALGVGRRGRGDQIERDEQRGPSCGEDLRASLSSESHHRLALLGGRPLLR
jgi:hypothetical protein